MKRYTNFIMCILRFQCFCYVVLFILVCIDVYTIKFKVNVIIILLTTMSFKISSYVLLLLYVFLIDCIDLFHIQ